ncbi:MAG: hypothetical protein J6Q51_04895 [Clostridia bacterium]|nr:hypothetical protein [Clostridia bacterium]
MENKKIPPKRKMPENLSNNPAPVEVQGGVSVEQKPKPVGVPPRPMPPKRIPPKPVVEQNDVEEVKVQEPVQQYEQTVNVVEEQAEVVEQVEQVSEPVEQVAEPVKAPKKQPKKPEPKPEKPAKPEKVKKEKVKKVKPPKKQEEEEEEEPEEPKEPKKRLPKKVKLIMAACVSAVVVIAAVICFFAFQPKPEKLPTPTISMYNLSNQTYLYVDQNLDAEYYEFFIQKIGDSEVKYIKTNTHEVSLKSFFDTKEELGDYEAWARYGSNNELVVSDLSERKQCKYTKTIDAPVIEFKTGDASKVIWNPVANATAYYVYYGTKASDYFKITPVSATAVVEFNLYEFDTKGLSAGNYSIQVQAIGSGAYYLNSNLSNVLAYTHKITLAPLSTAVFSKETKVLTVSLDVTKTPTHTFEVTIIFAEKSMVFVFDSVLANTIAFDLKLSIENSGYNVDDIRMMSIKAKGENIFVADSTAKSVSII